MMMTKCSAVLVVMLISSGCLGKVDFNPNPEIEQGASTADTACVPKCDGKLCGSDGCGGSCGGCAAGTSCDNAGQCKCSPQCDGKACGPDGCDGTCKPGCTAKETCSEKGTCQCVPQCTAGTCADDGCGHACPCASGDLCLPTKSCCTPGCAGKECGKDACGNTCGPDPMPTGKLCIDGKLVLSGDNCANPHDLALGQTVTVSKSPARGDVELAEGTVCPAAFAMRSLDGTLNFLNGFTFPGTQGGPSVVSPESLRDLVFRFKSGVVTGARYRIAFRSLDPVFSANRVYLVQDCKTDSSCIMGMLIGSGPMEAWVQLSPNQNWLLVVDTLEYDGGVVPESLSFELSVSGPFVPTCATGASCGDDDAGGVCVASAACASTPLLCKGDGCPLGTQCIDHQCTACGSGCTGKVCGSDGCGGQCEYTAAAELCDGQNGCTLDQSACKPKLEIPGYSCPSSIDIATSGYPWSVSGNSSQAPNDLSPTCCAAGANCNGRELRYRLTTPAGGTYFARVEPGVGSGFDPAVYASTTVCGETGGLSCSGVPADAVGPEQSEVLTFKEKATNQDVTIVVDSSTIGHGGPFTLTVEPACDIACKAYGRGCGSVSCGGDKSTVLCTTCTAGNDCSANLGCPPGNACDEASGTCKCVPKCTNPGGAPRVCGGDLCGDSCGACAPGDACRMSDGQCELAGDTCETPIMIEELPFNFPPSQAFDLTNATSDYGFLNPDNAIGLCLPEATPTSGMSRDLVFGVVPSVAGPMNVVVWQKSDTSFYYHVYLSLCGPGSVVCSLDIDFGKFNSMACPKAPPAGWADDWLCAGAGELKVTALEVGEVFNVVVDGYDNGLVPSPVGPFALSVCAPTCTGVACGGDGCGGTCPDSCLQKLGTVCDPAAGQCVPCSAACDGKSCGPDGCGHDCGMVPQGWLCSAEGTLIDPAQTVGDTCQNPVLADSIPFQYDGTTLDTASNFYACGPFTHGGDVVVRFDPPTTGTYRYTLKSDHVHKAEIISECVDVGEVCQEDTVLNGTSPEASRDVFLIEGNVVYFVIDANWKTVTNPGTLNEYSSSYSVGKFQFSINVAPSSACEYQGYECGYEPIYSGTADAHNCGTCPLGTLCSLGACAAPSVCKSGPKSCECLLALCGVDTDPSLLLACPSFGATCLDELWERYALVGCADQCKTLVPPMPALEAICTRSECAAERLALAAAEGGTVADICTAECCAPNCDGLSCGQQDGCGHLCGCAPGSVCNKKQLVCVPTEEGDTCDTALPIDTLPAVVAGDNANGFLPNHLFDSCIDLAFGAEAPDVVYTIIAPATGAIRITMPSYAFPAPSMVAVFDGCPATYCLGASDWFIGPDALEVGVLAGATYYVAIGSYGLTEVGPFEFHVDFVPLSNPESATDGKESDAAESGGSAEVNTGAEIVPATLDAGSMSD